jgi:hypothetical protein
MTNPKRSSLSTPAGAWSSSGQPRCRPPAATPARDDHDTTQPPRAGAYRPKPSRPQQLAPRRSRQPQQRNPIHPLASATVTAPRTRTAGRRQGKPGKPGDGRPGDHPCRKSHHQKPPTARPYNGRPEADSPLSGGRPQGAPLPTAPRVPPEVSPPNPPFLTPSRPSPGV